MSMIIINYKRDALSLYREVLDNPAKMKRDIQDYDEVKYQRLWLKGYGLGRSADLLFRLPESWGEDTITTVLNLCRTTYIEAEEKGKTSAQWEIRNALGMGDYEE